MQCKDIPDEAAIAAARDWRHPAAGISVDAVSLLVSRTGAPEKVAYRKLERLCERGLLECGVSPRYCWPVEVTDL